MPIPKSTLLSAFEDYKRVKDSCSVSGNWDPYCSLFVPKGCSVDHHGMGKFFEREGIKKYIVDGLAPYPNMEFPIDWVAVDESNSAVVFQVWNAFPSPPFLEKNTKFAFPNWTRLVLDESTLKWKSEETVYNPLRDAGKTLKAWKQAGGKFQSEEKIKYQFSKYPNEKSKL